LTCDDADGSTTSGDSNELTDSADPLISTSDTSDEDPIQMIQIGKEQFNIPPGLDHPPFFSLPQVNAHIESSTHDDIECEKITRLRSHARPFVPSLRVEGKALHQDHSEKLAHRPLCDEEESSEVARPLHWNSGTGLTPEMVPLCMHVPDPVIVQPFKQAELPPFKRIDVSGRGRIPFTPFTGSTMRPKANTGESKLAKIPFAPFTSTSKFAKPGGANTRPANPEDGLKAHLRHLACENEDCIIMVRKISKLGLESASLLEVFFSRYGAVKRVLVSHVHEKVKGTDRVKIRPAGIAFVVLESADAVAAAYAAGTEQKVLGVTINIGPFESKLPKEKREEENWLKSVQGVA
jgi:hypothetical protein